LFVECPPNPEIYGVARELVEAGRLSIDAESGIVYGRSGVPLKGKRNTSGYVQLSLRDPSNWRRQVCPVAHRVIWEHVHGPIPDGLEVNHRNGIKDDNRIANLELLTNAENVRHAFRTGLNPPRRGEQAWNSRLTDEGVRAIRAALSEGRPSREIAEELGVGRCTVNDIRAGRSWTHVA
jgi:HNH endonuclease